MIACDICQKHFSKEDFFERIAVYPDVDVCPDCDDKLKKHLGVIAYEHEVAEARERREYIQKCIDNQRII